MTMRRWLLAMPACLLLGGCFENLDTSSLTEGGGALFAAATADDATVASAANQSCAAEDQQNRLAPASYQARLKRIMTKLPATVGGAPVDAKVYQTDEVNAWAMGNGCVRVYSGLMDMMTDDEVTGVLGHEMGHVALGHSKRAMQVALAAHAARAVAVGSGNTMATSLSEGQIGQISESFINAQFSQRQESQADDYSYDLLKQKGVDPRGLVTAFQKLAQLDGGKSSMFASHPASSERARHIEERIAADSKA